MPVGLSNPPPGPRQTANRRVEESLDWRSVAAGIPALLHKLAFGSLLCWLLFGIAQEGWAIWRSPLRHVDVSGVRTLSSAEVVAMAGLEGGTPLSEVEPFSVAVRLLELPRVNTADVRRVFPGRVNIVVTERTPAVLLMKPGAPPLLIDSTGVVLGNGRTGDPLLAGLPRLEYSGALPDMRTRLPRGQLTWGFGAAQEIQRLGLGDGGGFTINLEQPFEPVFILPGKRQRVILPQLGVTAALQMLERLDVHTRRDHQGWRTLDLRIMEPSNGARIVIGE